MKICAISDTHTHHDDLILKEEDNIDVLIHAGDLSYRGTQQEIISFLDWFERQPATYKVFIAGNHDFGFENKRKQSEELLKGRDVIYLNDSGVKLMGKQIWGSPVQPWFHDWAFNRRSDIQEHWDLIPDNTDVLITHGPPHMILDKCLMGGNRVGCPRLLKKIQEIKPQVHIFGHIHEGYGVKENIVARGNSLITTKFVNASFCGFPDYQNFNKPIFLEI